MELFRDREVITKEGVFNSPVVWGILALLFLVLFANLIEFSPWLWQVFSDALGRLPAAIFLLVEEREELPLPKVEIPAVEEEGLEEEHVEEKDEVAKKEYVEVAESGEGITHLARRALRRYLEEHPQDFEITPEHKIYIEDYIRRQTGDRWLILGETLTFSEELIVEAINRARQLTPEQLENLKQYSQLVAWF